PAYARARATPTPAWPRGTTGTLPSASPPPRRVRHRSRLNGEWRAAPRPPRRPRAGSRARGPLRGSRRSAECPGRHLGRGAGRAERPEHFHLRRLLLAGSGIDRASTASGGPPPARIAASGLVLVPEDLCVAPADRQNVQVSIMIDVGDAGTMVMVVALVHEMT